jgi:enoyl-CoA hydratase/carnithine racemase
MALPSFAVVMARHRLDPRHLTTATMGAEIALPDRALAMGYLDEVMDDPLSGALVWAGSMAELPPDAFAVTKRRVRRPLQQELASQKLR